MSRHKETHHLESHSDDDESESFFRRHWFWFIVLPGILVFLVVLNWASNSCGSNNSSSEQEPDKSGGFKKALCGIVHGIQKAISAITSPIVNAWKNLIMLFSIVLGAAGLFWMGKKMGLLGGKETKMFAEAKMAEDKGAKVVVVDENGKPKEAFLVDKNGKIIEGIRPTKSALKDYNAEVQRRIAANEMAGPPLSESAIDAFSGKGHGGFEDSTKETKSSAKEGITAEGGRIKFSGAGPK